MLKSAIDYWTDAAQRTVLFWDVMRQRGNQYREHLTETAPTYSILISKSSLTAVRYHAPLTTDSSASFRRRASKSI